MLLTLTWKRPATVWLNIDVKTSTISVHVLDNFTTQPNRDKDTKMHAYAATQPEKPLMKAVVMHAYADAELPCKIV